jgi:N-acetylmuramoyl-L-alanine amidase
MLKASLKLILALLFVLINLIHQPLLEHHALGSLKIEFQKNTQREELCYTFISKSILNYDIKLDKSTLILTFYNMDFFEVETFLPEEATDSVFSKFYETQSKQVVCTLILQDYPYPSFKSSKDFRSHQLTLGKISPKILFNTTIVIDPGHGAFDEETLSIYDPGSIRNGLIESKINLDLSFQLKERLEKRGAKVYLTRDQEYSKENLRLEQRFDFVNMLYPTIFLSIHQNDSDYSYPHGVFLYYENSSSLPLAREIFQAMGKQTGLKLNHILNDPLLTLQSIKSHYGLLIECAFFSSEIDRKKYQDPYFLTNLAEGIEEGIVRYFAKS